MKEPGISKISQRPLALLFTLTANVKSKENSQQDARGETRCGTPPAYDDCRGRGRENPFWRNLEFTFVSVRVQTG